MSRPKRPIIVEKRVGYKTYLITLNTTCGLPDRICREWYRKSFQNFPPELVIHSHPKTKAAAETAGQYLVAFLKNGTGVIEKRDDPRVGEWLRLFTSMEESPRGARLIAKNRPYSEHSVDRLKGLYEVHMKDDPFMELLMSEVEPRDALAFMNRMGLRKLVGGRYKNRKEQPQMVGTESFAKLVKFVRMAFREYGRTRPYWYNVFSGIDAPEYESRERDAMFEDEVLKLFYPGVLLDTMELAVCSAMFLSGLRRSEVFALKPEDLDWRTPKIMVRRAWQNFSLKKRKMGPPKGKRPRAAPFDQILQDAIKKLWEENGEHEFVFSFWDKKKKQAYTPGPSWIKGRFKKWLARAEIKLDGRELVPHSARHSLAVMLEARGVSLRHIQELLDHRSKKTTKGYLHSTDKTIRDIGNEINGVMEKKPEPAVPENVQGLKVVKMAG